MAHISIIGGAGALGSALAKTLLEEGYTISCIDIARIEETPLKDLDVNYIWKAIQDLKPSDIKKADVVVFASAVADRPMGNTSPSFTCYENVMGTVRFLDVCSKVDLEKAILPGSGTIFLGVPPEEQPITEETLPKPTNPYSATKYTEEIYFDSYRRQYDVPSVILRSGAVFGPGGRSDISIMRFIRRALNDERIEVRSPHATRTYTYIEPVLEYWLRVIEADPEVVVGEVFHSVSPAEEKSILDTAREVVKILDSNSKIEEGSYEAGEIVRGKPVKQKIISTKDDVLGVNPTISFEEGVRRTAKWYKSGEQDNS